MDCGPTCTQFLRYGGRRARDNAPTECGNAITGQDVREKHHEMRDKTGFDTNEKKGTVQSSIVPMCEIYASVWRGKRYRFSPDQHRVFYNGPSIFEQVVNYWDQCLAQDRRGVMIPIQATHADPRLVTSNGSKHWVVYLGQNNGKAMYYDPGGWNVTDGHSERDLVELAYAYVWFQARDQLLAKERIGQADDNTALYLQAVFGEKIAPEEIEEGEEEVDPEKDVHYIRRGKNIANVDVHWSSVFTYGEDLIATADAKYFNDAYEADQLAESYLDECSAVVVEYPRGVFAVVKVDDVGASLASDDALNLDHDDAQANSFMAQHPGSDVDEDNRACSYRFYLAYEEDGVRHHTSKIIRTNPRNDKSMRKD